MLLPGPERLGTAVHEPAVAGIPFARIVLKASSRPASATYSAWVPRT
jgi:hypothetical protein